MNADDPALFAVHDALSIDAPAMLEKAASALRAGLGDLAAFYCQQATRKLGLLCAEERPEELGRAMLDAMGARARGIVLHHFAAARAGKISEGVPEKQAEEYAARKVADALGLLYIAPEHYTAVLFARRWWFMEWLPMPAWQALDALAAREAVSREEILERALCALAADPD